MSSGSRRRAAAFEPRWNGVVRRPRNFMPTDIVSTSRHAEPWTWKSIRTPSMRCNATSMRSVRTLRSSSVSSCRVTRVRVFFATSTAGSTDGTVMSLPTRPMSFRGVSRSSCFLRRAGGGCEGGSLRYLQARNARHRTEGRHACGLSIRYSPRSAARDRWCTRRDRRLVLLTVRRWWLHAAEDAASIERERRVLVLGRFEPVREPRQAANRGRAWLPRIARSRRALRRAC